MASVYVTIAPSVLRWAAKQAAAYAEETKQLQSWLSQEKKPTFRQIEILSNKLHIPLGYFFLPEPPKESFALGDFRTVQSQSHEDPSRELLDTTMDMQNVQDWMRDYIRDNGGEPLSFVGSCTQDMSCGQIAASIRKTLGLPLDWSVQQKDMKGCLKFLRTHCQDRGILVMMNGVTGMNTHRPLNIDEFRAFALTDPYAPLIFINTKDTDGGKIFSLLHEVVHIFLGKDNLYNEQEQGIGQDVHLEAVCNAVAAELLVPESLFQQKWNASAASPEEKIRDLAKYFHCSAYVIARRALTCGYITKKRYHAFVQILVKQYKVAAKKSGGGNFLRTMTSRLDQRFLQALGQSIQMGRTMPTEAYYLTHTNRKTFSDILRESIEEREDGRNG